MTPDPALGTIWKLGRHQAPSPCPQQPSVQCGAKYSPGPCLHFPADAAASGAGCRRMLESWESAQGGPGCRRPELRSRARAAPKVGAWARRGHPVKLSLVAGCGPGQGTKAPLRSPPASEPATCPARVPTVRFKVTQLLSGRAGLNQVCPNQFPITDRPFYSQKITSC